MNKYKGEIRSDFGVDVKDIVTHLLRKGVASNVSSGLTCGSPHLATNGRVG